MPPVMSMVRVGPITMRSVLVPMGVQMLAVFQPQDQNKHRQKDSAEESHAR
jgi:hypothetical protein